MHIIKIFSQKAILLEKQVWLNNNCNKIKQNDKFKAKLFELF